MYKQTAIGTLRYCMKTHFLRRIDFFAVFLYAAILIYGVKPGIEFFLQSIFWRPITVRDYLSSPTATLSSVPSHLFYDAIYNRCPILFPCRGLSQSNMSSQELFPAYQTNGKILSNLALKFLEILWLICCSGSKSFSTIISRNWSKTKDALLLGWSSEEPFRML